MEIKPESAPSKKLAEDLLITVCGLATSVLTAFILWWVEIKFGFAFYTWMFWFVIPVGALFSGFAGASGYFAGSWLFGHRPTRLLLLNMVIGSVLTFFLIHYLSYITIQVEGKQVSDYISFWRYLDIAVRSMTMESRLHGAKIGTTGELGSFGYVVAVLQVLGFAFGGLCVYGYLASKPHCSDCSRYLSGKGKQIRYATDADGLQAATVIFFASIGNGDFVSAVQEHKNSSSFGSSTCPKNCYLRSVVEVRYCKKCGLHWVKYAVEKYGGNDWKEIKELCIERFTNQVVTV